MTDEHDLDARLRARYRSRSADAAPPTLVRRVFAIPTTSPHRRGWLPRHTSGGFRLMFNATKMAVAVTVLAFTGTLLVTQGLDHRADVATPGAAITEDQIPGYVDGSIEFIEQPDYEATGLGDEFWEWTSPVATVVWETGDARLSGQGTAVEHGLQHFTTYTGVRSTMWTIENDEGSWIGNGNSFSRADGEEGFIVLTGLGAYEGLSAYVALPVMPDFADDAESQPVRGVIFPAAPLPSPEIATQ